ncbi:oxygen-independent coproporphyrinogen-3 oxidase [Actinomadura hallensis]|uniref:Heme chaperone HemW n=1 Tax=Actinomadura hallensis TaxID=337895 RepID=A0A543IC13_9ACTN|nr:STM4012 family radical SAM protein [Actinomadura hallensis]TQM68129.1 oxygen-independent coproporphyrinogen-3 oxidase [Actinomadura hallensis]HLV73380.1 STM4012 family radical SAM protein [Vulgatibacteraceae bacterium]
MTPYQSYVYAYPHKTAYRPLRPEPLLRDVWAGEDLDTLFLYLHVPFCEMRCGFCNLFTRTGATEDLTGAYLDALDRQATAVLDALGDGASFATSAFGGGTPTYLTASELERLCDIAGRFPGFGAVPLGVETSPATATTDRLTVLAERGTTRISIGVQSFLDEEARAAVRPQKRAEVEAALDRIRAVGFPSLNIDLIYGIDGQTPATWMHSLNAALAWRPEEIYLYPLYVRPLTGLARREHDWDDQRLTLYRIGRDHLLSEGYEQVSMRMFRLPGVTANGTEYCCQTDGMVGLGCGARSYTSHLHYSFEYAVGASPVRAIIDAYVRENDFTTARVGFRIDDEERRRRHLLQSLLQASGVERGAYRARFGTDPFDDFRADLTAFADRGWLETTDDALRLTPEGLAYSDAIGPALFSSRVRDLMAAYEAR